MHTPDDCPPPPAPSPDTVPPLVWGMAGLRAAAGPADVRWLVHGYLAEGMVTLLTSQWKAGKTTLVSVLLARMKAGGQVAGLAVAPGKAIIISEEPKVLWERRGQKLDLEEHVGWWCRPFDGRRPSPQQWQALLDRAVAAAAEHGVRLVVIDPLAPFFCGKSENDAAAMLALLASLQPLTARGLAVLLLHHPGKDERGAGPSGRGSGALLAGADILMELRWYHRPDKEDRRRRLLALSRFDETPRQLVLELNAEGTDYLARGSFAEEEFAGNWQVLHGLLLPAERKLTRAEILGLWPGEEPPDAGTLYRWLRRAVAAGLLRQDGRGKGREPFRYWLPEAEARWRKDPLAWLQMPELLDPPRA